MNLEPKKATTSMNLNAKKGRREMKRDRDRVRMNISEHRQVHRELLEWQRLSGIELIRARPTEDPDVVEFDLSRLLKAVNDATALQAAGMSARDATRIVCDRLKLETARK